MFSLIPRGPLCYTRYMQTLQVPAHDQREPLVFCLLNTPLSYFYNMSIQKRQEKKQKQKRLLLQIQAEARKSVKPATASFFFLSLPSLPSNNRPYIQSNQSSKKRMVVISTANEDAATTQNVIKK